MQEKNIGMGEMVATETLITEEKNAIKMRDLVPAGREINNKDVKEYVKKHKADRKLKKKEKKQEA